jgi:ribosomal protein S27E
MRDKFIFPHNNQSLQLQYMSSIKCPQCSLVNFATAQFCKRCNISLANTPVNYDNNTQIINTSNNTSVRPTMPLHGQNQPIQPPQFIPPTPQYNQPYQPQYQPHNNEQANNNQSNDYTLPRFLQGQPYQPQQQYRQSDYSQSQYGQNQFVAPQNPQGVWRRGNEVVIHKHAAFPAKCVKCGQDFSYSNNGEFATQKFRWHNPLVYIALISPLIYVILAACLSERFSYNIPYCQTHLQERETTKNYLIGGSFAAVGLIVLLGMFGAGGWAFLVGLVSIFAIPIAYEYAYKPFRVKSVDGQYVYLQGATQEYLNTLPY